MNETKQGSISRATIARLHIWKNLMTQLLDLEENIINDIPVGGSVSIEGAIATTLGCALVPKETRKEKETNE